MRDLILSLIRSGGPMTGADLVREIQTMINLGTLERPPPAESTLAKWQGYLDELESDGLIRMGPDGYEAVYKRPAEKPAERMLFADA